MKLLLSGFWLGALDDRHLSLIDQHYYDAHRMYVDRDYNLNGFQQFESHVVERHFQGARKVLVLACGAGREVVALERLGIACDGYECNCTLVEAGKVLLREERLRSTIRSCDRDDCPDGNRDYDAAIIGWSAYTHIRARSRRVRFLRAVARRVRHGGPLLLSFLVRSESSRYFPWVTRLANMLRSVLLRERAEVGDDLVNTFAHHFTRAEIGQEISDAGLRMTFFSMEGYGHAVGVVPDEDAALGERNVPTRLPASR